MQEIIATANNDYLSKHELVEWINDLLKIKISRIEVLGTGAIYCQIIDVIHPGKIQSINRVVEVNKLVKCKNLDNLEFVQWIKKYFDAHQQNKDYDPIQRRGNCEIDFSFLEKVKGKESAMQKQQMKHGKSLLPPKNYMNSVLSKNSSFSNLSNINDKENSPTKFEKEQNANLSQFEAVKNERDFYFSKLKDVDHLLDVIKDQNPEVIINKVREILYCAPEKVVVICDDGNIKTQPKNNVEDFQRILEQDTSQDFLLNDPHIFDDLRQNTQYSQNSDKNESLLNNDENLMSIEDNMFE